MYQHGGDALGGGVQAYRSVRAHGRLVCIGRIIRAIATGVAYGTGHQHLALAAKVDADTGVYTTFIKLDDVVPNAVNVGLQHTYIAWVDFLLAIDTGD